jgi:hypothetical protein
MASTLPLTTIAVTTVAIGLTAVYAAVVSAPDALEAFEQLPIARFGVEELVALLSVLINIGAVASVLAGPGSVLHRLVWSVLILLPLGMVAYVAFCRGSRRKPPAPLPHAATPRP